MKLGGTVPSGPSKKWPRRTTDSVWAGITEKRAFLRLAEKWFLPKNGLYPQKITQNDILGDNFLGKGNFFLWTTFSGRGQNMVRVQKWPPFLGPKFQFLAKKSNFCHTTPILFNDPFLALTMTVNFWPWERFFDFSFWSYSCLRKKIRLTCQKVFPLPTVGTPSASNSPTPLSTQALRAHALRARAE